MDGLKKLAQCPLDEVEDLMESVRVLYAELMNEVGVDSVRKNFQAVPPEVRELLQRSLEAIIKSKQPPTPQPTATATANEPSPQQPVPQVQAP